jgi:hypothetical protein
MCCIKIIHVRIKTLGANKAIIVHGQDLTQFAKEVNLASKFWRIKTRQKYLEWLPY